MPKGMIRRSGIGAHWQACAEVSSRITGQSGAVLSADVLTQGKPVLLNVWATWCPTCRAEHQYLNQLSAQGIRVVGMNYKDDRQKAISWLKELGNPYALSLFDGDGMLGWISVSMARQKRSLSTATASFAIAMRAISILASGKRD